MSHSTSTRDSNALPRPIGQVLGYLPPYPGSLLFVAALNRVLVNQLPGDVLGYLLHKKLRIEVRDACVAFDFSCTKAGFSARRRQQAVDLVISANARDFLRLAQRQEDPDTLFFNRRLSMEGDTELGLIVKNSLDALEMPFMDLKQWTPQSLLARYALSREKGAASKAAGSSK